MIIPTVKLDKHNGTVTIDRSNVLVIPNDANNISLFLEWLQRQPKITPRHTSMTISQSRHTVTDPDFWEPLTTEFIYGIDS